MFFPALDLPPEQQEMVECAISAAVKYEIPANMTLHISLDALVFEEGERGPDEELRLQFEAVSHMPPEEKQVIKALLDGMIIKHQTKQMVSGLSG